MAELNFITIPKSIIFNDFNDSKLISTFSFFEYWKNRHNKIMCTVESIVEWCGFKPNKHIGKTNYNFIELLEHLYKIGYLKNKPVVSHIDLQIMELSFNWIKEKIDTDHFAKIYLDELEKIMSYKFNGEKTKVLNNASLLLLFAYLRMSIITRNTIFHKDSDEDITNHPEAFYTSCPEISNDLSIGERTIYKLIDILEELGLIHVQHVKRKVKAENQESKWVSYVIFVNRYKRCKDGSVLSGEEYYLKEVEAKMSLMNKNSTFVKS